ncbi:phosphonatase-like hydrolase [Frondihabitans sp. PhB188]|uniref:HAD family hydrolase n=1 Tax=Frondihabitans sp. PhB188 TaxID=2485200 RepID=UPI000F470DEC|nr:HAD family hydrolase [Frondihabitans sp. PhB188]ROQ37478.1 phosphonatase-like hydrolase [Frondihabitans sp. PhB188]
MIELAVFDMAGTTVDDGGAVYRALATTVTEAGATLDDADLQTWMGTDKVTAITALLRLGGVEPSGALVAERFDRFKDALAESYRDEPPVAFDGVAEALGALRARGIKVALTTGFDRDVAWALLDSLGWGLARTAPQPGAQGPTVQESGPQGSGPQGSGPQERAVVLDAVVTTSDVAAGRPAPYMIHHAMELAGVEAVSSVLAAGDTLVDLRAARNAGVIAVGVLTGALGRAELEAEPHDYVLDGVVDVPGLAECRPAELVAR